jgi:3-hydroxyacyl-[acyl-carrier-protein] dehydratase
MPPPLLIDLRPIDLDAVCLTQEQIYELLPHGAEFRVLDGVCHIDQPSLSIVGFCDIRPNAWWSKGHLPGRPILPGVLMLEMGAQLGAVLAKLSGNYEGFIGYGGVEGCKFREAVIPPARLYLLSVGKEHRPRRIVSAVQGVIEGRMVFEATVTGVMMR